MENWEYSTHQSDARHHQDDITCLGDGTNPKPFSSRLATIAYILGEEHPLFRIPNDINQVSTTTFPE